MDIGIILTYRCNSRCSMCNIWKYPSRPEDEIGLDTLNKIPGELDYLNLTGGEPTLRTDLNEIVDLLYSKGRVFEISSNGLKAYKLEPIIKKYPNIKIRFSLDGFENTNNKIRGERNGYRSKVDGLIRLKELGGKDLGFAITIQDDNINDLIGLFEISTKNGFELATSTLHNGFQFHKNDNVPYNRFRVTQAIEELIIALLRTNNVKNWFRAYLNLGLIAKVLGIDRLLPCSAGTSFAFVDPWGDVFACNVRPDLKMGNLVSQSWDDIIHSSVTREVKKKVGQCQQNCWMVGSAKTAMRNSVFPQLPRWGPLFWVVENKLRVSLGRKIEFGRYIDTSQVYKDETIHHRTSYLNKSIKRQVQNRGENHYTQIGEYKNR